MDFFTAFSPLTFVVVITGKDEMGMGEKLKKFFVVVENVFEPGEFCLNGIEFGALVGAGLCGDLVGGGQKLGDGATTAIFGFYAAIDASFAIVIFFPAACFGGHG